jgi:SRSO17 transposase
VVDLKERLGGGAAVDTKVCEVDLLDVKLEDLHERIARHFVRSEVRETSLRYMGALIGQVDRKNCWQLAEAAGDETPDGMQRLLRKARWDADEVRDDLRKYVVDYLGEPGGVLIIDETGFIKKGTKSVGVKRQYTGTAGKIENSQIGVFLAYSTNKGKAFIDRELYLPEDWTEDKARCKEAGVPSGVKFATKPELAKKMLKRAFKARVPCRWVTGDEIYGNNPKLWRWLERNKHSYVLAIASNQYVRWDLKQVQASKILAEMVSSKWVRMSIGAGSKGEREYDWAWIRLPSQKSVLPKGFRKWLVFRRGIAKPEEIAYFIAFGPEMTSFREITEAAGKRWGIEVAFEEAKGETGLDEYEVRKWESWYRHITLSLMAHAYLVVKSMYSNDKKGEVQT